MTFTEWWTRQRISVKTKEELDLLYLTAKAAWDKAFIEGADAKRDQIKDVLSLSAVFAPPPERQ